MLNVVSDIIELQRGKVFVSDSSQGRIGFTMRMYGFRHRYDFSIQNGGDRCSVELETDGDAAKSSRRLGQMFALLESLMELPAVTENSNEGRIDAV